MTRRQGKKAIAILSLSVAAAFLLLITIGALNQSYDDANSVVSGYAWIFAPILGLTLPALNRSGCEEPPEARNSLFFLAAGVMILLFISVGFIFLRYGFTNMKIPDMWDNYGGLVALLQGLCILTIQLYFAE